jgi:hypothetical protein
MVNNNEEIINWRYCMELALIHSNKINKGTINVFNTPHIMVLLVLFRECFPWGYCNQVDIKATWSSSSI